MAALSRRTQPDVYGARIVAGRRACNPGRELRRARSGDTGAVFADGARPRQNSDGHCSSITVHKIIDWQKKMLMAHSLIFLPSSCCQPYCPLTIDSDSSGSLADSRLRQSHWLTNPLTKL